MYDNTDKSVRVGGYRQRDILSDKLRRRYWAVRKINFQKKKPLFIVLMATIFIFFFAPVNSLLLFRPSSQK